DLCCAFLPTLGLVMYIWLDHLWSDEGRTAGTTLPRRLMGAVSCFWRRSDDSVIANKQRMARILMLVTIVAGTVQYSKGRADNAAAAKMSRDLALAVSLASSNAAIAS